MLFQILARDGPANVRNLDVFRSHDVCTTFMKAAMGFPLDRVVGRSPENTQTE